MGEFDALFRELTRIDGVDVEKLIAELKLDPERLLAGPAGLNPKIVDDLSESLEARKRRRRRRSGAGEGP
jgi:hypothetical protein